MLALRSIRPFWSGRTLFTLRSEWSFRSFRAVFARLTGFTRLALWSLQSDWTVGSFWTFRAFWSRFTGRSFRTFRTVLAGLSGLSGLARLPRFAGVSLRSRIARLTGLSRVSRLTGLTRRPIRSWRSFGSGRTARVARFALWPHGSFGSFRTYFAFRSLWPLWPLWSGRSRRAVEADDPGLRVVVDEVRVQTLDVRRPADDGRRANPRVHVTVELDDTAYRCTIPSRVHDDGSGRIWLQDVSVAVILWQRRRQRWVDHAQDSRTPVVRVEGIAVAVGWDVVLSDGHRVQGSRLQARWQLDHYSFLCHYISP